MYAMLYEYCREVAEAETRTITIFENSEFNLPPGHYSFIEMFCNDPGCDCRRCFFMVRADWSNEPLAYIGYGWESADFYTRWMGDDEISDMLTGAGLEPMQPQSKYAPEILRMFEMALLPNREYIERVKRHYALMRSVVDAPEKQATPKDRKQLKREREKIKREKERNKKQKQPQKRGFRVTTTDSSGRKIVKAFDKSTYRHPTGKISTAFVEFIKPFVNLNTDPQPSKRKVNSILNVSRTVWNAVVFDTTESETTCCDELLAKAEDHETRLLIEFMIQNKLATFGDDQRLIGDYEYIQEEDGFRLKVTAKHPPALGPLPLQED